MIEAPDTAVEAQQPKMYRLTAEVLLEACYPLGDGKHSRDAKRLAVRRTLLDGWSLRAAGREANAGAATIGRWLAETEERIKQMRGRLETCSSLPASRATS